MYSLDPRVNPNIAHDNLRNPAVDEVSLLLERQLLDDLAIKSRLAYRQTRHMYEFDDTNRIWDEDGSGVIGSRNSDPNIALYRLRTPALAKRDYVQWDLILRKVPSHRWQAQVTYTYTYSVGSSSQALSGSFANDPQTQYNYGPFIATDLRHVVKGYAIWELPTDPWTQALGLTFEYYSGRPLERFYYGSDLGYSLRIRPRGVYARFPSQWSVGLKFQQDIDIKRGKLRVSAEATNLFNNRAPDNFYATFYTENRLLAASRQDPLRIQLGAEYQF
jgi:hypothetical protein